MKSTSNPHLGRALCGEEWAGLGLVMGQARIGAIDGLGGTEHEYQRLCLVEMFLLVKQKDALEKKSIMGEHLSQDRVFEFPMNESEPHPAYDFFAPRPLSGYGGNPNNNNGWIEADVPLPGELGAEADGPMAGSVVDEIAEPIVEMEDDDDFEGLKDEEEVWEVNEEWLMAPTPPPIPVVPLPSTYEVGGHSTVAVEGQSFTLPALRFPMPSLVIEDLCTRMSNLEYGHGQLVKKVIQVSDDEVADGITIREIGPRVSTVEGQEAVQQRDSQIQQLQTMVSEMSCLEETDGWTVVVLAKATGQKYKVFKETATGKKFYSKPQVLNYLGIADSSNSNKRKVKVAPPKDQQISTISTTPSEIPKRLYDLIQKVAKLNESVKLNSNNRFAKSKLEYYKPYICAAYVNKDEDNQVSGAEYMECKFYKLTLKYIFYVTIEAIKQGICGVYETRVECVTENGKMTLQNFVLTEREPKGNRPSVKSHLESKFEYETVEAYGGSYGGGYQPRAYSSDATAAAPTSQNSQSLT
ncbi:hypothetical protein Tco_0320593 [Tanacetum coccineum]